MLLNNFVKECNIRNSEVDKPPYNIGNNKTFISSKYKHSKSLHYLRYISARIWRVWFDFNFVS